jgi:fatty-acyl-CoA synthase
MLLLLLTLAPNTHSAHVVSRVCSPIAGLFRFSDLLLSPNASYDAQLRYLVRMQKQDEPINIQFTSGTTGLPKGATLTHRNIVNNGYFNGEAMSLTPADSLCIPVPLYHCFGLVLGTLAALSHGAQVVYPCAGFDAAKVLHAVHTERCTGLHSVPTMFIAMLNHPNFSAIDFANLRTGIMGTMTIWYCVQLQTAILTMWLVV